MESIRLLATSWVLLAEGEAPKGPGSGGILEQLFMNPLIPFLVIGLLFYFLLIRPERRKKAEMVQMLENLKANDRVVTAGGIYGTVVNVKKGSEDVTLRVDENNNTKLRVLRSSIMRIVTGDERDGTKEAN